MLVEKHIITGSDFHLNCDSFIWYQQLSKFNEANVITIYMEEWVGKFLKGTYMIDCATVRDRMYLQDWYTVIGTVIYEPAFLKNPASIWALK